MSLKMIKVSRKVRDKIAKTYNVTPQSVGMALNFQRNSQQCVAMRVMALENGGKFFEEKKASDL